MSAGRYTELTFINGSTAVPVSAENLNEVTRVCEESDNERARSKTRRLSTYLNYFWDRNIRTIERFVSDTSFSSSGTIDVSADTTNYVIGKMSVKVKETDATGSVLSIYKATALDLTNFNDGSSSGTDDIISVMFYVSDLTKFQGLTFKLGDDASNYYYATFSSGWRTGWNTFYINKSDFIETGSPSGWDTITYLRIDIETTASATNEYMSFQYMQLVREDPDNPGYGNPFQWYDGTSFVNYYNVYENWSLVYDERFKRLIIIHVDQYDSTYKGTSMLLYGPCICFQAKLELYCREQNEIPAITWRYDADNYIKFYGSGGSLELFEVVGGVLDSATSVSLDNNLTAGERYELFIERNFDMLRMILKKDGESNKIIEFNTTMSLNYDGYVWLGHYGDSQYNGISDWLITHTEENNFDSWKNTKIIIKEETEEKASDTSLSEDSELYCYLPPNSIFEIETMLYLSCSSNTPDIKIDLATTNIIYTSYRRGLGLGTSATTGNNAQYMRLEPRGVGTDTQYGIGSGSWTLVNEKIIVATGTSGGRVAVRWAQNVSDAATTSLKENSYMKITKLQK
jgi:hypothetical protein